jgi:hypothetical protein
MVWNLKPFLSQKYEPMAKTENSCFCHDFVSTKIKSLAVFMKTKMWAMLIECRNDIESAYIYTSHMEAVLLLALFCRHLGSFVHQS